MQLKDVHNTMDSLNTYLSRSNDKNKDIELLKLTVLFDISESLKTISKTLSDPNYENGVIDMLQRVYGSIDDLSSDISDNFTELKEKS